MRNLSATVRDFFRRPRPLLGIVAAEGGVSLNTAAFAEAAAVVEHLIREMHEDDARFPNILGFRLRLALAYGGHFLTIEVRMSGEIIGELVIDPTKWGAVRVTAFRSFVFEQLLHVVAMSTRKNSQTRAVSPFSLDRTSAETKHVVSFEEHFRGDAMRPAPSHLEFCPTLPGDLIPGDHIADADLWRGYTVVDVRREGNEVVLGLHDPLNESAVNITVRRMHFMRSQLRVVSDFHEYLLRCRYSVERVYAMLTPPNDI